MRARVALFANWPHYGIHAGAVGAVERSIMKRRLVRLLAVAAFCVPRSR